MMTIKELRRILLCAALTLAMVVQGAFVVPVYAASEAAPGDEAATEAASEAQANLDSLEDLLQVDGDSATEAQLQADDEIEYDGYIYRLKDSATGRDVREMEKAGDSLPEGEEIQTVIQDEIYSADSLETISQVVDADLVEYVEPNLKATLMDVSEQDMQNYIRGRGFTSAPNDTYYNDGKYDWQYKGASPEVPGVNVASAWARGCYGQDWNLAKGVIVVTLDSGVDSANADLDQNRVYKGATFYKGVEYLGSEDENGHGTFVAGLINGKMNNGRGITGFMPDLYIYPIKLYTYDSQGKLDGGYISDIIMGLERAMDINADVINMSLGIGSNLRSLEEVCDKATKKGIIIVASAGNDYNTNYNYPASYGSVICVGSVGRRTDADGNSYLSVSAFSNHNSTVDVAAPGERVRSLAMTGVSSEDGTCYNSGTSFSTPIVTALAGMCKGIDSTMTAGEFRSLLVRTSDDYGTKGRDNYYGYGLVNFGRVAAELLDDTSIKNKINIKNAKITNVSAGYKYTGNSIKPKPVVTLNGTVLVKDLDYSVSYSNNYDVGKATVKVTGVGKYTGSISKTYRINPVGTKLLSVVKTRSSLNFKWQKQSSYMSKSRISGYQVQIARNSAFTKSKKGYYVSGYGKVTRKFTGLRSRTYYYARVRTYKTLGGVKYYSAWSKKEKVKTL